MYFLGHTIVVAQNRGRKTKNPDEKRTYCVSVRLSKGELQALQSRTGAKCLGTKLRNLALYPARHRKRETCELSEVAKRGLEHAFIDLARIASRDRGTSDTELAVSVETLLRISEQLREDRR